MTTTTTTVGYGDFNADKSNNNPSNMMVIMMLQLFAIFSFTLIRDKIFSIQYDVNLEEVIKKREEDVELYLFNIDRVMKRQSEYLSNLKRKRLEDSFFEDSINSISTSIRYSPNEDFHEKHFYNQLTPRL